MIRHELPDSVVYNLLDSQVFLALSQRLSRLREELVGIKQTVLIDKIPRGGSSLTSTGRRRHPMQMAQIQG